MAARGPLARDIPRGQRAFLHALMSAGSFDEDRTKLAFASALALDNEDVPEASALRNARLQQYLSNISARIEPFHMQIRYARDEVNGNYTLAISYNGSWDWLSKFRSFSSADRDFFFRIVERIIKNKTGTLSREELRELRTVAPNAEDQEGAMDTTEDSIANSTRSRSSNDTTLTVKLEPGAHADADTSTASTSSRAPAPAKRGRGGGRGRGGRGRGGLASASQRATRTPGDSGETDPFVARLLERNWLHRYDEDGEVRYAVGGRALAELDGFLRAKFAENLPTCKLCKQIVLQVATCDKCGAQLHERCAVAFWKQASSARVGYCPLEACGVKWPKARVEDLQKRWVTRLSPDQL